MFYVIVAGGGWSFSPNPGPKNRMPMQLIRVEGSMCLTIVVIMFVIRVYTLRVLGYEKWSMDSFSVPLHGNLL